MKRIVLSRISILLCFALILPTAAAAAPVQAASQSVSASQIERRQGLARAVNMFSNIVITAAAKTLGAFIPNTMAVSEYSTFDLDSYGCFFRGHAEFLDAPAQDACWQLGYAKESILPADFGEKAYTIGGGEKLHRETTACFDDLCVRVVALDDGSGRGKTVFAVLDAVGIANYDVRMIRKALWLYAEQQNIVSLNISVTHTHNGIDLQGAWNVTLPMLWNNITKGMQCYCNIVSGVDSTFLQTVIDQTRKAVTRAVADMRPGTLTLAKKDIADYVWDRTAPNCFDSNMYRLLFTPADGAQPTVLATWGVHPEGTIFEHDVLSADFIAYTDALLCQAGYNFIFIQGCVGTITYSTGASNDGGDWTRHERAVRYGTEIGLMLLSLTLTEPECAALNKRLGDPLGVRDGAGKEGYSVWYADWQPVEEKEVEPLLNIRNKQYIIPVTNPLMTIIGRIGVTDNLLLIKRFPRKYYSVTECGYMEIGHSLKVALSPGETFGELLTGDGGRKGYMDGFAYPSLRSLYGEELIVFDLMNDAIGYLEPDNYYVMLGMQYDDLESAYNKDFWCAVSFGQHTASTVIGEFIALADSVRA